MDRRVPVVFLVSVLLLVGCDSKVDQERSPDGNPIPDRFVELGSGDQKLEEPSPEPSEAKREESEEPEAEPNRDDDTDGSGTNKALSSDELDSAPKDRESADSDGLDSKSNRAMAGQDAEGRGGMGTSGAAGVGQAEGGAGSYGVGSGEASAAGGAGTVRAKVRPASAQKPSHRRARADGDRVPDGDRVRPMTPTTTDPMSTFAVDVDTGSYTLARRELEAGQLPDQEAVRPEEFINYFDYEYPNPSSGPFGVYTDAAPSPMAVDASRKLLRVGVQGKRVDHEERKPAHLTFLIDASGSMEGKHRLDLVKESLHILTDNLKEGDTVAIATYASKARRVLGPTGIVHRDRIRSAIDQLEARGATAMHDGFKRAYQLAMESFEPNHLNRLIVLSDGDANVGPDTHDQILETIEAYVEHGVEMSSIGFGTGNYRDEMMEQLADNGNGNYAYVDDEREARRIFEHQITGTLETIAKDVKIQVEFDKKTVRMHRLIGYENRDIPDEDFRDDAVDAGEIGAGHSVTALYEIVVDSPRPSGPLATVRVRHKKPTADTATEQTFAVDADDIAPSMQEASADLRFAAAVGAFAELLRGSPHVRDSIMSYELVEDLARSAAGQHDAQRQEFLELVGETKAVSR